MELIASYYFNTTPTKLEWQEIQNSLSTLYPGITWSSSQLISHYPIEDVENKFLRWLWVYDMEGQVIEPYWLKYGTNPSIPQGENVSWTFRNHNVPNQDGRVLLHNYSNTENLFSQLDESLIKKVIREEMDAFDWTRNINQEVDKMIDAGLGDDYLNIKYCYELNLGIVVKPVKLMVSHIEGDKIIFTTPVGNTQPIPLEQLRRWVEDGTMTPCQD